MQKYIVIADDLTGSNATCSLFKKIGLRAASILKLQGDINYDVDVISYSTASRGLDKEEAYKKVSEAIKILKNKDVLVYNKRIDSTLRGNIGTEINAMLDNLEDDRIAIVIPSYPDSGRIVVNKTMLVNGVLLENSDAGKDPKTPIKTSCVESLIQKGIKYSSTYFTLSDIEQPIEEIVKKIQEAIKIYGFYKPSYISLIPTLLFVIVQGIEIWLSYYYNRYCTSSLLANGYYPIENDVYSIALLKEFTYIPYTKEELEDKFIREEYKKHSDSARKEERDKFKTVFIIWFIIFVILMIIGRFEFSVIWK